MDRMDQTKLWCRTLHRTLPKKLANDHGGHAKGWPNHTTKHSTYAIIHIHISIPTSQQSQADTATGTDRNGSCKGLAHGPTGQLHSTLPNPHRLQTQSKINTNTNQYDAQQCRMLCRTPSQTIHLSHIMTTTYLPTWMHTATNIQTKTTEKSTLQLLHKLPHYTTRTSTDTTDPVTNVTSDWSPQQQYPHTTGNDKL